MFRCLSSLTMLAAHMLGMFVPVYFVECRSADGHARITPVDSRCACCNREMHSQAPACPQNGTSCPKKCCRHDGAAKVQTPTSGNSAEIARLQSHRTCCTHSQIESDFASVSGGQARAKKLVEGSGATIAACLLMSLDVQGTPFSVDFAAASQQTVSALPRALCTTVWRC